MAEVSAKHSEVDFGGTANNGRLSRPPSAFPDGVPDGAAGGAAGRPASSQRKAGFAGGASAAEPASALALERAVLQQSLDQRAFYDRPLQRSFAGTSALFFVSSTFMFVHRRPFNSTRVF